MPFDEEPQAPGTIHSLRELLVDVLGSLVPGILFVFFVMLTFFFPLQIVVCVVARKPSASLPIDLSVLEKIPSVIWFFVSVFMLFLSYVLGHLFYRSDPKVPDQASFSRLSKPLTIEQAKNELACDTRANCEFPYTFISSYLATRGLQYLLVLVPWRDTAQFRSKNYINILKIRLGFHHGDKLRYIIRNEAHIRLASSTWYMGRTLIIFAAIAMAASLGLYFTVNTRPEDTLLYHSLLCPLIVLGISWFIRWKTERFIHYQRLREIVFVLDTAYTAFRDTPKLLRPPFDMFGTDSPGRETMHRGRGRRP